MSSLRRLLLDRKLDGVLVADVADVRYLSGFRGDEAILVVSDEHTLICSDSRFWTQIADEVTGFELVRSEGGVALTADALAAWIAACGRNEAELRLGFQGDVVPYSGYRRLRRRFRGRLVNLGERVSGLREIKDAAELQALRAAAAIADAALETVIAQGLRGHTETDVAWAVEQAVRAGGAEAVAFPTIVATGPHGALPHAIAGDVVIGDGDLVVVDMGARLDGYHSDITRTFAVGRVAGEERAVYDVVLAAQLAGLDAARGGVEARAVDAAARDLIDAAGYGQHFGHGTGHGVGLEIHEKPRVGRSSRERLAPGMVVTVEPGIYLEGRFGVRIEDTVVVTTGACERLTLSPKELRVVG
jgi:Xaa-Pro aminopeptidase